MNISWIVGIFLSTILISALFSTVSESLLSAADLIPAFCILLVIVLVGIAFDVIGVAVTAADARPFHSMAAHRVRGAQEALTMLRHADKVSSFCNDVIGDICGVVSGTASASIAALILIRFPGASRYLGALLAALVSGITVGGKAIGKTLALKKSTKIVYMTAGAVYWVKYLPRTVVGKIRRKQQKTKK